MQLSIAKKLTYDLLKAENLLQKGWRCKFDDAKNRLGQCDSGNKLISLSRYFIALNDDAVTLDTIRHEVAHALTTEERADHGAQWKAEAFRLGADPQALCTNAVAPKGYFLGICRSCGKEIYKHREPQKKNQACSKCCHKYSDGRYDQKFLLVWENLKTGEIFTDGRWVEKNDKVEIDRTVAQSVIETFGAASVIELKELGKLPDFQFDDYDFRSVPDGIFRAHLDVKLWRDVKGYRVLKTFWQSSGGDGIVIDVWENSFENIYETADKRVNVQKLKVGNWYELIVMRTDKGFLRLQSVKVSN